jgi:hypothetical protein
VDDGSTLTYDNFTVEYVHFEGAGGVGSSLPPNMSTSVPEAPRPQRYAVQPRPRLQRGLRHYHHSRCSHALQQRRPPLRARPLGHQLVSRTRWSSLLRSPTMRSASTLTTTVSRCGIVRWRTFSATSRCRDWPLTIWRRSRILRATTVCLGPSQRPRDTRHRVPRCSRRWTQLRRTAPASLLISLVVTARSLLS